MKRIAPRVKVDPLLTQLMTGGYGPEHLAESHHTFGARSDELAGLLQMNNIVKCVGIV